MLFFLFRVKLVIIFTLYRHLNSIDTVCLICHTIHAAMRGLFSISPLSKKKVHPMWNQAFQSINNVASTRFKSYVNITSSVQKHRDTLIRTYWFWFWLNNRNSFEQIILVLMHQSTLCLYLVLIKLKYIYGSTCCLVFIDHRQRSWVFFYIYLSY